MDMDFQVGDEVQCLMHGEGVVIYRYDCVDSNIEVRFKNGVQTSFTKDGRYYAHAKQILYHDGSVKYEGSKIIIDPVKPARDKWVNVYIDSDGRPFFGDLCLSKEDAEARMSEGVNIGYITTIQLKRKKP